MKEKKIIVLSEGALLPYMKVMNEGAEVIQIDQPIPDISFDFINDRPSPRNRKERRAARKEQ